jgi:hypothetical protein
MYCSGVTMKSSGSFRADRVPIRKPMTVPYSTVSVPIMAGTTWMEQTNV